MYSLIETIKKEKYCHRPKQWHVSRDLRVHKLDLQTLEMLYFGDKCSITQFLFSRFLWKVCDSGFSWAFHPLFKNWKSSILKNGYHCPILLNKIQTAIYNTIAASTESQNSGHGFLPSAAGGTQDWGAKRWDTLSVWIIPRNKWTFPGLRFNYAFPDCVDSHGLSSKCWQKATGFFRVEKCLFRATVTINEGWEGATCQPASHSHLMKWAFWEQQRTRLPSSPMM